MQLRDARTLAVLVVLVLAGGGVGPTGAVPATEAGPATDGRIPTYVDSCRTIDRPGTYVLTTDIENGGNTAISQTCFEITADDVTFDGDGHVVDGRGESHTKGITVVDAENVTVRDVSVNDWHAGVRVADGSATVRDVHTFSNAYGVKLENASGSTVAETTVESNLVGIYTDSENVTLTNNDVSDNEIAVQRDGIGL